MYKFYLSPYNDLTLQTKDILVSQNHSFLGFIDNYRVGTDICHIKDVGEFDYIIINSPNYYKDIYDNFIKQGIKKNKILFHPKILTKPIKNIHLANIAFYLSKMQFDALDNILYNIKYYFQRRHLKNIHQNKKAFIIGNGPSLQIEDLNKLKNEITFAANKIYLSYSDTTWRPTYYFVEDDLVFKQNYDEINDLKQSIKIFPLYLLKLKPRIKKAVYFDFIYRPKSKEFPQFNPKVNFYGGNTVVYTMIQWAIYMGIKEIYLLGLDYNFITPKSKEFNLEKNQDDYVCEGEINHFHKDYRKEGEIWHKPDLDLQLKTYAKAKEYCDNNGIKIYNVSRQTKLNIFDKKSFDEIKKN